jgi:hypothetical protein
MGAMGFMTKRVGRGEKKGEPEVDQRTSTLLHKERSRSMPRMTRHIAANEGMRTHEKQGTNCKNKTLNVVTCEFDHAKMTFTSLAFIGVAAILSLLFSSGVKSMPF